MEKVQPAADPGTGGVDATWARAAEAREKKPNTAPTRLALLSTGRTSFIACPFL